jgi:hypothetical protein
MNKGILTLVILIWMCAFVASSNKNNSPTKSFIHSSVVNDIYKKLNTQELSFDAFKSALIGFSKIQHSKLLENDSLLTIIDFSLPSTQERLFVIDLKNSKLITESLVAHGKSTGDLCSENFSNKIESHQSSLGFYITEDTYLGKNGYSLRLNGIEKDINDNAKERAIVIHGADYVSKNYINKYGRIGRSFGCPALPLEQNKEIIDLIKNNTCLFIYYPTSYYFDKSTLVNSVQLSQITAL